MKKVFWLIILSLLIPSAVHAAEWDKSLPAGSTLYEQNDDKIRDNNGALDRVLANYREGARLEYSSASQITVTAGEVVCSNLAGTARKMRSNPSSTTVTWANIDTGSEATATTYYVYANCDASADTFTIKISTSSSAPSGVTSYKKLGSFHNDGSSNIILIDNDNIYELNSWASKSIGVTYQALNDGFACATITTDGSGTSGYITGYTDPSTTPTTVRGYASSMQNAQADHSAPSNGFCMPVVRGDYYKVDQATWAGASADGSATLYFVPLS